MHLGRILGTVLGTLCLLLLVTSGCGSPSGPPTTEVVGKLVFTKGGDPKVLADRQGMVAFESVDHPGVMAFGDIQVDGSFTPVSIKDDVTSPGLVNGTHRVRLQIGDSAAQFVSPKFRKFETSGLTVTVEPGQKEVVVNVFR